MATVLPIPRACGLLVGDEALSQATRLAIFNADGAAGLRGGLSIPFAGGVLPARALTAHAAHR